jgi:catechol 2,3-dioxygenase-like lactoylglutathione lyase family enzyme
MTTEDLRAGTGITGLHHVGLVVRDIAAARARYRSLGFHVPPATFPALPPHPGAAPRAFGAGNTHASFRNGFIELATVLDQDGRPGDEVRLHPIAAPDAALARLTDAIAETAARLRAALDRFEGMHILALGTPDADATAAALDAAGVRHGGVHRLLRPIETRDGARREPVGYLELDDPARTPEGRLAVAEDPPEQLSAGRVDEHPNGARALAEVLLCVPDAELDDHADRYRGYLGRPARHDGPARVFDLATGSRVVVAPASGLAAVLPGERPPTRPAFVACTVAVRDLGDTAAHLEQAGVPHTRHPGGRLVVPAAAALGCAVVFQG